MMARCCPLLYPGRKSIPAFRPALDLTMGCVALILRIRTSEDQRPLQR